MTADGSTAVFLVDSKLSQTGEGSCKPSVDTCSFVYLRAEDTRDEHFFADEDGTEYSLRLLAVEQKPIRAKSARSSKRRPRARDARRGGWSFDLPLFADERR